jgi:osmotically-inducible protein OsmY
VSRVDGVLDVDNHITISNDPIPSDVADRINKAFERSAIIDNSRITVTSHGHTINLDGTVGSYAAMQQAEDTAWAAPGVTQVDDHLVIEP